MTVPSQAVRRHKVLVFTTPTCAWCTRAKTYLRQRGVPFTEVDVSRDPAAARDLVRRTGQTGVPQRLFGGRHERAGGVLAAEQGEDPVDQSEHVEPLRCACSPACPAICNHAMGAGRPR